MMFFLWNLQTMDYYILALVGMECQEARIGLSQAMETLRAPPSLPSTRLGGCHNIVHL